MKISELFGTRRAVVSFEFFPPKTPQGETALFQTIERLRPLRPAFVSVTYGAGGSSRDKTIELVTRIKTEIGIKAGIRDGAYAEWDEKGNKRAELNFVDGKLDGTATIWGADGKKITQQYDDGKLLKEAKN